MKTSYTFNPVKDVPFKRKAGVELTWTAPVPHRRGYNADQLNGEFSTILDALYAKPGVNCYREVYADPGCVEIPSHILYSWKDLEKFWNFWEPICEGLGLDKVPDHSTGGGGHIHIDCTEWEQIKVGREIAARPYLSWVFLHPSDDINGQSIAYWMASQFSSDDGDNIPFWMNPGLTAQGWKNRQGQVINGFMSSFRPRSHECKSTVINMSGSQGLEFRAFTGAYDLEEQYLHMAFLQRYVDWVLSKKTAEVPWANKREARSFLESWRNYDRCEDAFFDLILELGLDPKAYQDYPRIWMKPRFTKKGMGRLI
jgi:hypothetical protein